MKRVLTILTAGVLSLGLTVGVAFAQAPPLPPEMPRLPDLTPAMVCFSVTDDEGETHSRELTVPAFVAERLAELPHFALGPCDDDDNGNGNDVIGIELP